MNFSTSNTLIIKPRDFSISIISDEYTQTPSREGYVGSGESALDFGYIVTTSGKTAADEVLIKVTGPAQVIGGRSIVSSAPMTVRRKYRSRRHFPLLPATELQKPTMPGAMIAGGI